MADSPPIACTLSSADLRDRDGAWVKLMASGLVQRQEVPGGIRLSAAPGAAASLLELIELERESVPGSSSKFAIGRLSR